MSAAGEHDWAFHIRRNTKEAILTQLTHPVSWVLTGLCKGDPVAL